MKIEYINPFIESVNELFSTMLGSKANRESVALSKECHNPHEITALIGLSGQTRGTVALSFPEDTALAIVSRFLGSELTQIDDTLADGLGELANIVAGGAKARLHNENAGPPVDLSLPNVIKGASYSVGYPRHTTWLDVPFSSDLGSFNLRVTLERGKEGEK